MKMCVINYILKELFSNLCMLLICIALKFRLEHHLSLCRPHWTGNFSHQQEVGLFYAQLVHTAAQVITKKHMNAFLQEPMDTLI